MLRFTGWYTAIACLAVIGFASASNAADQPEVDFNRDIRPILSDRCFACHGPDEHERAANLRIDTLEGIQSVVSAGDARNSELVRRIKSTDEDEVMPPAEFHKPLSSKQIRLIESWVRDGAEFQKHWAFQSPIRPTIDSDQPIDALINQAAIKSGLSLNPIADKRTLVRRVTLDLTGLPPTVADVDAFVKDHAPDAYERLVDRLLASKHYGQHVGRYWLDLVRYGDTHGLHLDNYREMWPYRDWVIDAFNANMPFDQFITEQLAGDLLPGATDEQKIASGFNRLNVTTNEGGSIYEEVFARNVMDRTDAFGTIFMGLTTGCAVCHDHKFDPITMRDYYSLSGFFNSLDGRALDGNTKDHPPVLSVRSPEEKRLLSAMENDLAEIRVEKMQPIEAVDQAQTAWEQSVINGPAAPVDIAVHPESVESEAGVAIKTLDDGSFRLDGPAAAKDTTIVVASIDKTLFETATAPQILVLRALVDKPTDAVGASSNGNVVLSEIKVEAAEVIDGVAIGETDWFPIEITRAAADHEQSGGKFAVAYAVDKKIVSDEGWAVAGHEKTGGRTAWFTIPELQDFAVGSEGEIKIRVQLKYQSLFAAHQFRHVQLSLSNVAPSVTSTSQLTLGDIHAVGPFPFENTNAAYTRKIGPGESDFDATEVFRYQDRDYRWQHRGDAKQIGVVGLPSVDDRPSALFLHQTIDAPMAQKASILLGTDDGHTVSVNGKQVGSKRGRGEIQPLKHEYEFDLKAGVNHLVIRIVNHNDDSEIAYAYKSPAITIPEDLSSVISVPRNERSTPQAEAIRRYYRLFHCDHPEWQAILDHEKGIEKTIADLVDSFPTTLIWKETASPREARVLLRGQYETPGEVVPRSTPDFLPPIPEDTPVDRLGLAKWLLSDNHPLTSRVAVNRFWQQLFGVGIVKTSEDFGSQGEPPSNQALLDFLAIEFREGGWDVKSLMKQLVMTDAYRRSAMATENAITVDPENRLLARGPRFRLDAEVLRDQALAISGLLVDEMGGPSVKPPQPDGLWLAVGYSGSNTVRFTADIGDDVYRRSVYIFWKRTSAPPQMATFDAPSRESCTARRERTNTPLQALLLMNETQYVEAAKKLAQQSVFQSDAAHVQTRSEKISDVFLKVTMRPPTDTEQHELQTLWDDLNAHYAANPDDAKLLCGDDATSGVAAWTVLCSTLLNLDEVITK